MVNVFDYFDGRIRTFFISGSEASLVYDQSDHLILMSESPTLYGLKQVMFFCDVVFREK